MGTPMNLLTPSWHEREVERRHDARACQLAVLSGYPYDCAAARRRPADLVLTYQTHRVWWTVNPQTGRDRTDELNDRLASVRICLRKHHEP